MEETERTDESTALSTTNEGPKMTLEMTVGELVGQVQLIQQAMRAAMREGEHFGVIPGTQKPTLLKPGAEKLSLLFKMATEYSVAREDDGDHREYSVTCRLSHQPTTNHIGEGVGSCSTKETKYRYRRGENQCPQCGASAVIRGKKEYGGGWLCWKKKEGCGAKFDDDAFTDAQRVENPDLADTYNTVLKMAKKRAFVDAVLSATAASDIFTQDIEELAPRSSGQVREAPVDPMAAAYEHQTSVKTGSPGGVPDEMPDVFPEEDTSMATLKKRLHAITDNAEDASTICHYVVGMRLEEVQTQEDAQKVLAGMDAANSSGIRDDFIFQSAIMDGNDAF